MHPSGANDDRPTTDRARTLLTITNAIAVHLTRDTLFPAITLALRQVMAFDRSTIFLFDDQKQVLRLVSTDSGVPTDAFVPGMELELDRSRSGWAFVHQRPYYNPDLAQERTHPGEEILFREGFRSLIVVPLIAHGTSIGTLSLGSLQSAQYEETEAELLKDVATQLALAIENMRQYEEVVRLKAQLERENTYLREEIARERQLPAVDAAPEPTAVALPIVGSGTLEDVERAHILAVLAQTGWVIEGPRGAAKILDMHPNTLRSRLKKLGVQRARHGIALPPPVEGV
jgi:GAF domain-containing protein